MSSPPQALLDDLMERASVALARMDYLACEALCLDALRIARRQSGWAYYARILLPLQEARRQRRLLAAQGAIALGVTPETAAAVDLGCVVLAPPATAQDASRLRQTARAQRRHVEVLFADHTAAAPGGWTLRGAPPDADTSIILEIPAPPAEAVGVVLRADAPDPAALKRRHDAADWFMDAADALGQAALARIDAPAGSLHRLAQLEQALALFDDHEILHQRLADAARDLARTRPSERSPVHE